jgi:hypothetical protein
MVSLEFISDMIFPAFGVDSASNRNEYQEYFLGSKEGKLKHYDAKIAVVVHSYNKNQRDALISQIYFGIELCMFQTVSLYIIRSLALYTQQ